jgi:hypothetical protein
VIGAAESPFGEGDADDAVAVAGIDAVAAESVVLFLSPPHATTMSAIVRVAVKFEDLIVR